MLAQARRDEARARAEAELAAAQAAEDARMEEERKREVEERRKLMESKGSSTRGRGAVRGVARGASTIRGTTRGAGTIARGASAGAARGRVTCEFVPSLHKANFPLTSVSKIVSLLPFNFLGYLIVTSFLQLFQIPSQRLQFRRDLQVEVESLDQVQLRLRLEVGLLAEGLELGQRVPGQLLGVQDMVRSSEGPSSCPLGPSSASQSPTLPVASSEPLSHLTQHVFY